MHLKNLKNYDKLARNKAKVKHISETKDNEKKLWGESQAGNPICRRIQPFSIFIDLKNQDKLAGNKVKIKH